MISWLCLSLPTTNYLSLTTESHMIDLHCHLLPGIDDGAQNIEDALALARYAVEHSITHAVMTPHIQPGTYDNCAETIEQHVRSFQIQLDEHGIALKIAAGAEVRICSELLEMVPMGQIPFLGKLDGYDIMLLEFPHSHIPPGSDQLVRWLLKQHIRPLIAHPERNKAMHADPDKIAPFVSMGCLLQLTAGSVVGRFGELSRSCADYYLGRGWVEVLATDAHNLQYRPPELKNSMQAAAKLIGDDAAHALVYENPIAIAGNRFEH